MPAFTSVNPVQVNKATQKAHYDVAFNNTLHLLNDALTFAGLKTFSNGLAVSATQRIYVDGGGDTYIYEVVANTIRVVAGGAHLADVSASRWTMVQDLSIEATKKFYFDGGGDTYFTEGSANLLDVYAGGTFTFRWASTYVYSPNDFIVGATKKLYLDGGGDTYIYEDTANRIWFKAGGVDPLWLNATTAEFGSTIDVRIASGKKLYFDGGGDTYLHEFSANRMVFTAGGVDSLSVNATGVRVGDFNGASYPLHVVKSHADYLVRFDASHATTPNGISIVYSAATPNGANNQFFRAEDATAVRFYVRSDGGIGNYQVNNVNLSDMLTKRRLGLKPEKGGALRRIREIEFWMDQYIDSKREKPDLMWYAQQLETVDSDFVDVFQHEDSKRGLKKLLGTRDHQVFMTNVLATQELDAEVQELRKKILELESKLKAS
jgi:hypothetical protein